ncbi:hypothetical protein pb186bvf_001221 [Paramecium bursaria]
MDFYLLHLKDLILNFFILINRNQSLLVNILKHMLVYIMLSHQLFQIIRLSMQSLFIIQNSSITYLQQQMLNKKFVTQRAILQFRTFQNKCTLQ